MNLEDAMLSKINPTQKDRYCMLPWYAPTHKTRAVKFMGTESRMLGARGCEEWGVSV